jgi:predicted nucleic acid-binding protein
VTIAGPVLDCSVAVAWCFEDEATPELDDLLDQVQQEGAVVPPLWAAETANVLLMAFRRGRIAKETIPERLALLDMLPVETDDTGSGAVWRTSVLTLADAEALTMYDAIYLELAIRRGLRLASSDIALRSAASRHGVVVVPALSR